MSRHKTVTKRPTYADAITWIADNDNAGSGESVETIQGYLTVQLVADLFGASTNDVAVDVERHRAGIPRHGKR